MLTFLHHLFDGFLLGWLQQPDQGIESLRLFGIKLINPQDFFPLVSRFTFNLIVSFIIVRYLYYPAAKRKDYFFIYLIVSAVVFILSFALENLAVQIGFALGMFAIFGILRYRTDTIPIKEMTYLFLMVGVAVVNALSGSKVSYAELLFMNLALIGLTWYLEKIWMFKKEREDVLELTFEKIELLHAGREKELIEDLRQRTGLDIYRISIIRINYLRDTARLKIYFRKHRSSASYESRNY